MNKYIPQTQLISERLDRLTQHGDCSYSALLEAERYSVMSGGKHLRGLTLIQTAMLGGASIEQSLDFACALEMVHTYSLIHDDLPEMDDDSMRRGQPTCHVKFGHATALLAGDALLTKAFSVISGNSELSAQKRIECVELLSAACGEHGMLAGQVIDKLCENRDTDIGLLKELQIRKTADMFVAAVKMGCVIGSVPQQICDELTEAMNILGLAFQIKDDILDVTATSESLGKPVKSDEKSRKTTFVSLCGLNGSRELLSRLIKDAESIPAVSSSAFFKDLAHFFMYRTK